MSIAIKQQKLYNSPQLERSATVTFDAPTTAGNGIILVVTAGNTSQRLQTPVVSGYVRVAYRSSDSLSTGGWVCAIFALGNAASTPSIYIDLQSGFTGRITATAYEVTGAATTDSVAGEAYSSAYSTSFTVSLNTTPEMQTDGGMIFCCAGTDNGNAAPIWTRSYAETEDADVLFPDGYNFWHGRRAEAAMSAIEYTGAALIGSSRISACACAFHPSSPQVLGNNSTLFMAGD